MFHVTERLLLRPAWPEDAEAIHHAIADRDVVRNLARAPWPYSRGDACDYARRGQDARMPGFLVTLPSARGSQVIGGAGLGAREDGVELGYWIARAFWGRGYATEAARAVLEVGRMLGLRRISAGHFSDNPASGRVLRKIGFGPTGQVAKRFSMGRGEEADCVMFGIDLDSQAIPTPRAA